MQEPEALARSGELLCRWHIRVGSQSNAYGVSYLCRPNLKSYSDKLGQCAFVDVKRESARLEETVTSLKKFGIDIRPQNIAFNGKIL